MEGPPEKDVALIVSGGRTGTAFLGECVSEMVPRATSVHEPDVWPGFNLKAVRRIREFGLKHMVIDRLRGQSGMRSLSMQRLRGEMSVNEATTEIRRQRMDYYRSMSDPLVVESNYQAYGVLPEFRRVFPAAKIAVLARHPATWVASQLDYGKRRGGRDRLQAWGEERLRPDRVGDIAFEGRWEDTSQIERLCWDWVVIYRTLERAARDDGAIRIFRYEDLFVDETRVENFRGFLNFITQFPERNYSYSLSSSLLERRVNPRPDREVSSRARGETFDGAVRSICGTLMRRFGYGERKRDREDMEDAP